MLKYFVLGLSGLLFLTTAGCGGSRSTTENNQSTVDSDADSMRLPMKMSEETPSFSEDAGFGSSDARPAPLTAGGDRGTSGVLEGPKTHRVESYTPESRRSRQSGVLTAGSFDDVQNFTDFQSFLSLCGVAHRQSRWIPTGCQQTLITVRDANGVPIGNARCRVTVPTQSGENTLLDQTTGSDGRVMLLANHAMAAGSNGFRLQIWPPGQQQPVVDDCQVPGRRWDVTVANVESALPKQLDLALVIDTTGSMGDELEFLKTEVDSIVESVNRMFPNVDQRYSLITYRDNGDEYVVRTFDFTPSLNDFRRQLDQQSAAGGGDFPEAMDTALKSAGQLAWRKGNVARVMFLVGDAPPHDENIETALEAVDGLRSLGVRIYPVGASGVETTAQIVMRTSALLTMGQYLFLTDHSGVGNAHATPNVPEFAVERLDQLMVRMISSELAGKRLAPKEIIAIENGELQTTTMHRPQPCQNQPSHTSYVCVGDPYVTFAAITPTMPAAIVQCTVESSGGVWTMLGWLSRNGLAILVTTVCAVMVFDNLVAKGSVI